MWEKSEWMLRTDSEPSVAPWKVLCAGPTQGQGSPGAEMKDPFQCNKNALKSHPRCKALQEAGSKGQRQMAMSNS